MGEARLSPAGKRGRSSRAADLQRQPLRAGHSSPAGHRVPWVPGQWRECPLPRMGQTPHIRQHSPTRHLLAASGPHPGLPLPRLAPQHTSMPTSTPHHPLSAAQQWGPGQTRSLCRSQLEPVQRCRPLSSQGDPCLRAHTLSPVLLPSPLPCRSWEAQILFGEEAPQMLSDWAGSRH